MKKSNLKKIALLSLAGGALLLQTQAEAAQGPKYVADSMNSTTQTSKTMTEQDLMSNLNTDGKATYQGLDKEGKALALKLANQSCKGQNECKGLNSCKSADNACKGQGGCKGTSKGPFTDKNDAVKVAAKHMEEKRSTMMNGNR